MANGLFICINDGQEYNNETPRGNCSPVVHKISVLLLLLLRFQLRHGVWCRVGLVAGLPVDVGHGGDVSRRRNGSYMSRGGSYHPSGSPVVLHDALRQSGNCFFFLK